MARSVQSDFMHNFRYQVRATGVGGKTYLQPSGLARGIEAGFSAVTTPEMSQEAVEYREGTYVYTRKYPGVPSVGGDLTMSRGVARQDTAFWDWMRSVIEGAGPDTEYRADLDILNYHRGVTLIRGAQGDSTLLTIGPDSPPAKTVRAFNGFATRYKPMADLDATSGDVSVAEIDSAFEYFDVFEGAAPPNPNP